MTEHEKLIRRQIAELEAKIEDAKYKGQIFLREKLNREIGRLCQENNLERRPNPPIEKKFSGEL